MTWSIVNARDHFEDLAPQWDTLNERLHGSHPLLASSFVGPLVRHFATGDEALAIHRDRSEVDGLVLLNSEPFRWSTFLPSQTQIAPMLLSNAGILEHLLSALPKTVLVLDLLCLDPEHSVAVQISQGSFHQRTEHATTLNISLSTTFDDYWQARSRKLRQNLRRHFRDLDAAGKAPSLHQLAGAAQLRRGLERYSEIESRGWKAQGGTAIQLDTRQGRFYDDVLAAFAERDGATIYELHLADEVAASQITLHNRNMLITLKTTYDERFAEFSPGVVLDYLLLQREFAQRRFSLIEYYTNASAETLRWGTAQRTISHHRLYRYAWAPFLVRALRRLRRTSS